MTDWQARPVRPDDHDRWRELYRAYRHFYQKEPDDAVVERVWSWLLDPHHPLDGLVAVGADDRPVGLAHYRPFPRPLTGTVGGYLDDLFVDPSVRGNGAADLLLAELRRLAAVNGWSMVRWITSETNYRARAKYDQVATPLRFVTYDMLPEPPA